MKILLINHYAGSFSHGMEYRPYYLAREWVKCGHKVTILAASFSHLRRVHPQLSSGSAVENIEGIRYVWLRTPSYQGNGAGRVFNMFSFSKRLFSVDRSLIGFEPDVVIASSPHPFIIYPARHIQKKYRSKLIFEVRDLWPLTLIELGGISKNHPFVGLMQHAENYAYRVADRVVSLLPKANEYMQRHGMRAEKFLYIPNGIVTNPSEKSDESLPEEHLRFFESKKDNFLVGYTGTFTDSDTLDCLISAAKMIDTTTHFVLVGDGPYKKDILEMVSRLKASNVTVLPPVSKVQIPKVLARLDVTYIGWRRKPIYSFGVSPNKLFDYMMAAKPVIHAIEAGNDLVAESGCGLSIPPENLTAICDAVITLRNMHTEEREKLGLAGKCYVLRHHNYGILADRFLGCD